MNIFLKRTLLLSAGYILSLVMIAPAHAYSFNYNAYLKCIRTPLVHFDGTIAQAAAATLELSTLYKLVGDAGLAVALSAPGSLTVYAPVNKAFENIPAPLVGLLTADKELLTKVLTYHVSKGFRDPRISFYPKETNTLQGQTVFLDYENKLGPQVNQSNASCQGVRTSNGVVWLIDSVLLPQF